MARAGARCGNAGQKAPGRWVPLAHGKAGCGKGGKLATQRMRHLEVYRFAVWDSVCHRWTLWRESPCPTMDAATAPKP